MKRLLCPQLPTPSLSVELSEKESHHAVRVLRLSDGAEVEAMDGKGHAIRAKLRVRGEHVRIEFLEKIEIHSAQVSSLVLETAILKSDAMQWLIEKSVELGVGQLVPILTAHSVVQLKDKGPEAFQERWQKMANQALKQCGRLDAMKIGLPVEFENLLATQPGRLQNPRLWCDEKSAGQAPELIRWFSQNPGKTPRILIGPEGGFSELERQMLLRSEGNHCYRVDLGPLILRAETASLYCASLATSFLRTIDNPESKSHT
jgi:16S rRNA (uracil1498-N3)-methyltransferase